MEVLGESEAFPVYNGNKITVGEWFQDISTGA